MEGKTMTERETTIQVMRDVFHELKATAEAGHQRGAGGLYDMGWCAGVKAMLEAFERVADRYPALRS
jgi:hypothetical protein